MKKIITALLCFILLILLCGASLEDVPETTPPLTDDDEHDIPPEILELLLDLQAALAEYNAMFDGDGNYIGENDIIIYSEPQATETLPQTPSADALEQILAAQSEMARFNEMFDEDGRFIGNNNKPQEISVEAADDEILDNTEETPPQEIIKRKSIIDVLMENLVSLLIVVAVGVVFLIIRIRSKK